MTRPLLKKPMSWILLLVVLPLAAVPKARAAMERILEIEPNVAAWIGLSQVHLAAGRTDEALEHLDAAVALDPTSGTAHYMRSLALRTAGRTEEADLDLRRALELAPELAPWVDGGAPPE